MAVMGFKCNGFERNYHLKCTSCPINLTTEPDNTDTILIHGVVSKVNLGCQACKQAMKVKLWSPLKFVWDFSSAFTSSRYRSAM